MTRRSDPVKRMPVGSESVKCTTSSRLLRDNGLPSTESTETVPKASSILFLAYAGPDEVREFYRKHPFDPEGKRTWKSRKKFDLLIVEVRRLGWAQPDFSDGIYHPRVAVPVWTRDGRLIAVVGAYMRDIGASLRKKQRLVNLARQIATRLIEQLAEETAPCE